MKKFAISLLLILGLSFFSWKALLPTGFFTIHDDQQIARLFELDKSLSAGQFPVRWVKDLGFGYGYPLFNFYPPLAYYTGEIFHLAGTSFIDATKIVWLIALLGSGITMYFLAREFFGEIGGLVSSMFYLYAPYHAIDAYVRGALSELFSFVWLPLILLFSYQSIKTGKLKYSIWTGIVLALLMITHNLVFLPFIALFAVWYLLLTIIFQRQNLLRACLLFLVACVLGFGLTAFFWLPSLWEKKYTLVDQILTHELASYKIHFVCPNQLWDSSWGYGGSVAGCVDGLSFKLGKPHVLLALLSLPIAFYLWAKKKRQLAVILATILFLSAFSVFMTTSYSQVIWDNIPQLWYLQFPWRFLEFAALSMSFSAGAIFLVIKNIRLQSLVGLVLIAGVIFLGAKYFVPRRYLTAAENSDQTSLNHIRWYVSNTSFEYLPRDIATEKTNLGTTRVAIGQNTVARDNYRLLSGKLTKSSEVFQSDRFAMTGSALTASILQFSIVNFPGWKVWVGDKLTDIDDSNPLKLITIAIPPGSYKIIGQFTDTPVRQYGNIISLGFLLLTLSLPFYF